MIEWSLGGVGLLEYSLRLVEWGDSGGQRTTGGHAMGRNDEPQGCLFAILRLLGVAEGSGGAAHASPGWDEQEALPYQRKDYLLSKGERAFFVALQQAIGGQCLIFSKVRLADLVFIPSGTKKRQSYFNRIQSKHIDFVLCNHDAVRPMLAIELDDSSHRRADRQDRDEFVDSALSAAGLPMLRVPAQGSYDVATLRTTIHQSLQQY